MLLCSNKGPELFSHSKTETKQNGKRYRNICAKKKESQYETQTNNLSAQERTPSLA